VLPGNARMRTVILSRARSRHRKHETREKQITREAM
jgi:hypothetical protein